MATQNELLRQLIELQRQQQQPRQNQVGEGRRDDDQPNVASFPQFQGTNPPMFTKADEPLEADAWLRTIESKFDLLVLPCPFERKVMFAVQQLRGAARLWWDHFHAMKPANYVVHWEEFCEAFRAHHIPKGVMDRKLNEFLALNQGHRTVLQYSQEFNNLCQYARYHADSEEKKIDRFQRGLNARLQERLTLYKPTTYNDLVNMAISLEDKAAALRAEKKRKAPMPSPHSSGRRFRLVPRPP